MFQKTIALKIVGVLIVIVVIAILLLAFFDNNVPGSNFKSLGDRAFGNLVLTQELETISETAALSGLGGEAKVTDTAEAYPILPDYMPIDEIVAYEYIYEGELPDLSSIDARVFKKDDSLKLPDAINNEIKNLGFDWLSLSSFKDLSVTNLSATESNPEGYSISLDLLNGFVSIYKMYGAQGIDYSQPLLESDLPDDETLIKMSDEFLRGIGFDKNRYSNPIIDRSWIDTSVWVPESMQIVYPLKIEEREVYSLGGFPVGLSVTANLRSDKIDGIYGPIPASYETSNYELTTDTQAILDVVKKGGLWEYQPENAAKIYRATLGTPDVVLAEHYSYNGTSASQVIYIPALRFPVATWDEQAPYKKQWVVIPLVKEILETDSSFVEPELLMK